MTILKVNLSIPSGYNCLAGLDFRFFSDEYPEYIGSPYNDAFIAELDNSTWRTSGSTIIAPNNFAFDPQGDPISINASGATSMSAEDASGTTYDGATPLLSAATPITPGTHTLYLSIFDQGDHSLDSAVAIDNLRLSNVGNLETQCRPGAERVQTGAVISFGDSIAAGEGSGPHDGYPNNPYAYSAIIAKDLGWRSYNFAISGACAATSGKGSFPGTPSQCTKSIISDQIPAAKSMNLKPSLITITVGANDIRFADCVKDVLGLDTSASPCSGKAFSDHLKALQSNLGLAIARLRDLYGSSVPIAVTRYFSPMPGYESNPARVCAPMQGLTLAKIYQDNGLKDALLALKDLPTRTRDYQGSVSNKTLAILGDLNSTLTKTSTPFGATMVGLDFYGHDFCTDYDGRSDAWVLAPKIEVFASYYGLSGYSYSRNFVPAHRCVSTPSCDTETMFVDESRQWVGQRGTLVLDFWSNDFPHLTKPGQEAVAESIIRRLRGAGKL